jgi:hypothetical protein
VVVDKDLRALRVELLVADPRQDKLLCKFKARVTAGLLGELGESFRLRGSRPGGPKFVAEEAALDAAKAVRQDGGKHPLQNPELEVKLAILHDGKEVPLEFRAGEARARLPGARGKRRLPGVGGKVRLVLKRDRSSKRYGVVVKVNGVSTLFRQKAEDVQCRRWVLDPGDPALVLKGYQADEGGFLPFRLLSEAESEAVAAKYGDKAGLISVSIFEEGAEETESTVKREERVEAAKAEAVGARELPAGAKTVGGLRFRLKAEGNRRAGLIVEGNLRRPGAIRRVAFKDPRLVSTYTIVYFTPRSGK